MCGRAKLPNDYSEIRIQFSLVGPAVNWRPSWNIAPTQDLFTVVHDPAAGGRVGRLMRFGLVPSWQKGEKVPMLNNARTDGIDTKPSFRGAWKAGRRCIVVMDRFYEWQGPEKRPFAIGFEDRLMAAAGIWESWTDPTGAVRPTCAIVTTEANEFMASIHDRMPVILNKEDWPAWLGETPASTDQAKGMLKPYQGTDLTAYEVDKKVGNVRNNDATVGAPIQPETIDGQLALLI